MEMAPIKIRSLNRLAFYRSHHIKDGRRLVVFPYYEEDTFGYCIGWESEETEKDAVFWIYEPFEFLPRKSGDTAQEAVNAAAKYIEK